MKVASKHQNQHAAIPNRQNRPTHSPRFHQQSQEQRGTSNDQFSSLEALLKEYVVKNEAIVQSEAVSLKNLKYQARQLATSLSSRPQGSLPSNTEDLRREEKRKSIKKLLN